MSSRTPQKLEDLILDHIYSKIPNSILVDHLYWHFGDRFSKDQIDSAVSNLKTKGLVTNDATNRNAVFHGNIERESLYLTEYPKSYPYRVSIALGEKAIPRLLDLDRTRAEDVNLIIEALAQHHSDLRQEYEKLMKNETTRIYKDLIVIFGIFVSIFSLIVVSTEKMLRFNPDVMDKLSAISLFYKSAALFLPVGILIFLFIFLIWKITKR